MNHYLTIGHLYNIKRHVLNFKVNVFIVLQRKMIDQLSQNLNVIPVDFPVFAPVLMKAPGSVRRLKKLIYKVQG